MFKQLKTNYRAIKSTALSGSAESRENMVIERAVPDSTSFGKYKPVIDGFKTLINQGQFEVAANIIQEYSKFPFHDEAGVPIYYKMAQLLVNIGETESVALDRLQLYKEWQKNCPNCPYAAASLAQALMEMAWIYRGSDWAKNVSVNGWEKFQHHTKLAKDVFKKSTNFNEHWYWADVYQGFGLVECETANQVLSRHDYVAKIIPNIPNIYTFTAYALLPRWYGDYVEVEKFARKAADQMAHRFDDGLYAYINLYLLEEHEEVEDLHIDEPRFRKGCHDWLERVPSQYLSLIHI